MYRNFVILAGMLFVLVISNAHAQYVSANTDRVRREAAANAEVNAAHESYVGRKFWVLANPKAIFRQQFYEGDERGHIARNEFFVTESTSFVVTGFKSQGSFTYATIVFSDGKEAFLCEDSLFNVDPKEYPLFHNTLSPKDSPNPGIEYISTMSPDDLRIAQRKQRTKAGAAAAAWKARGGVTIGMTADQVRASNWGAPKHVNRSTGAYGVHEQWVYGSGNYIYFENGRVTSIQN